MKYRKVATGGTFDHLHRGHEALLSKSFEVGEEVIIGVTSDDFARSREGKSPDQGYDARVSSLQEYMARHFPGRRYSIVKLDDYFGPGIASPEVEAIVVTKETESRVDLANKLRAEKGFPPLQVVVVEFILGQDGEPISSTRIRRGEMDRDGRLL